MQPTVGRTVHYQSYGTPGGEYLPEPRAAIVTSVEGAIEDADGVVTQYLSLAVLNPTGFFFNLAVPSSPEPKPGHWNWPPIV
ncbi:hypothetical protein [Glutamicibacter ardleyensis]|uniref:Uncharacterized protein n=1 Tax=Glutamicibacter ardleyensis TaxID=225894 RepID=A0ABQ2DF53_9MICC|nr:hypothetical protein [Glutamicibacter ardleyensis]GGJ55588.1 hypothetical protein GCM10007173_12950 [Glutamicibacter ardleyensis]